MVKLVYAHACPLGTLTLMFDTASLLGIYHDPTCTADTFPFDQPIPTCYTARCSTMVKSMCCCLRRLLCCAQCSQIVRSCTHCLHAVVCYGRRRPLLST